MAKDTLQKMKPILANRNIRMKTKMRVIKTYVWSVLLYGSECWTLNKEIKKKLEAVEMWFIGRMMRISWTEKKSNELVLKEANLAQSLIKTMTEATTVFRPYLPTQGFKTLRITGKIRGKRSRGRQRLIFIENLRSWAIDKGSNNNFIRLTENRFEWRNMIANVCSQGT
ncbi:endonuclease-reverse transcriptase [Plakobranchus ocellatus]|uniref:Endonuclease-reverse transcriptase n=1 Tax=Plakobranchus ocellatus TaxID=259542 RepID=A0AAV3XWN6_9GAST|nr:endonuclease-reverse transcriptase [Plakobranchus ocellatus]